MYRTTKCTSSNITELVETFGNDLLKSQKDSSKKGNIYNQVLKEIERPLISHVLNIARGN